MDTVSSICLGYVLGTLTTGAACLYIMSKTITSYLEQLTLNHKEFLSWYNTHTNITNTGPTRADEK